MTKIGWHLLKKSIPEMLLYVLFIAFIVVFRPSLGFILLAVAVYILIRKLVSKTLSVKGYFKALLISYVFILFVYCLYRFIGGVWALVIAHICCVAFIIKSRWKFIMECDRQIKDQIDIIKNKRRGLGDE